MGGVYQRALLCEPGASACKKTSARRGGESAETQPSVPWEPNGLVRLGRGLALPNTRYSELKTALAISGQRVEGQGGSIVGQREVKIGLRGDE
jgi:hypothetical protein